METAHIKAINFDGYRITRDTNIKGKPVAHLYKLMTLGKNKGEYKRLDGFYFATEQRRDEWVKETFDRVKGRINEANEIKDKKAVIRANFVTPFQVGQVYYTSWGYDQTNVDFYEVTAVKGKTVTIQEIGAKTVSGSEGMMCSRVEPNTAHKVGNPETKVIQFYLSNNEPKYYIKSGRHSLSLYTKEDKGVYCSWYA